MTTSFTRFALVIALIALAETAPARAAGEPTPITEQEAYEIGVEAYVYLYPLISKKNDGRPVRGHPPSTALSTLGPNPREFM